MVMKAKTFLYAGKLPQAFYLQQNVVKLAASLLGKVLVTCFDEQFTAGRIVETEAYNGVHDKASHAWNGRRTARTEIMYAAGGVAYVYLCYGIHHLFNVVTGDNEVPQAVLVRSMEPVTGIEYMLKRTGKTSIDHSLTRGPGNVTKALGITTHHSGMDLQTDTLFLADDGYIIKPSQIAATARIGVDYAGDDALLPYRFILKNNPFLSGKKVMNPQD